MPAAPRKRPAANCFTASGDTARGHLDRTSVPSLPAFSCGCWAFTLAEAGLLDGRDATTHWLVADEFAARHPAVRLNPEVLYTDNGNILTSAGAASGFDLCLPIVERDYGTAVAADAARLPVAPLHRPGGQVLYIVRSRPTSPAARGSRVNAVGNRPRRLP